MSGFISLPRNRIHEKEETKKLNLSSSFIESFYKDFLDGIDFSQDNDFQQRLVNNLLGKDVKKFLLATIDFGEEIQGELELYVTNNRLSKASFRRRLVSISKSIIRNKNPIELLFKDVKHFDPQKPIIGYLIKDVDVGKKKHLSKFFDKAPDTRDLEIQSRLNKLSQKNEFFNRGDNNNFFPPNPPPLPLDPPPPSPPSDLFNI